MDCLPDKELHELLKQHDAANCSHEVLCDRIADLTESLARANWFPFSSLVSRPRPNANANGR